MRRLLPILFCVFSAASTFGQVESLPSSTHGKGKNVIKKSDSPFNSAESFSTTTLSDTLGILSIRLDSIGINTRRDIDSLKNLYHSKANNLINLAKRYHSKIDSLQQLQLPADKYTPRIDSIKQQLTSLENNVTSKIDSIQKKALDKINQLNLPEELKDKVSTLTNSINGLNLENLKSKLAFDLPGQLPSLEAPNILSKTGALSDTKLPDVPGLNTQSGIPDVKALGNTNIGNSVSEISGKTDGISGYTDEVKNLKNQSLDNVVESRIDKISEVQEIKGQTAGLPTAPSEEEAKAAIKKQIQTVAVNHFAGKEAVLEAAMDKLSQYKEKFPAVTSVSDLTKKPSNSMRGKALRERLIVGVALQIGKKGDLFSVDFNPYIGYRFTGRISAGFGWNQRVPYNLDNKNFSPAYRIYGPRSFGEFSLGKGFYPRLEIEVMNTLVPPMIKNPNADPQHREWVWGAFAGVRKEYRISRTIKGTAMVMARLFDPNHKSPYADVLNARVGIEIKLDKRKK